MLRFYKILRRTRLAVSLAMLLAVTALFVVPGAWVCSYLAGAAAIQWLPSAMAFSLGIAVGWLAVTLLLGRVYCSTICPLGTMQDIVSRVGRIFNPHKVYTWRPAKSKVRNATVVLTIVTLVIGITTVAVVLDPYSAYGRICHNIITPLLRMQWPAMVGTSVVGMLLSWLTLGIVGALSWRRGRLWCNTFCPVGTALGYVSRNAVFHIDIDTDVCVNCRRCEHVCKAECINLNDHVVDASRCVVCFDCLTACHDNAIRYTYAHKQLSLPMMKRVAGTASTATSAPTSTTSSASTSSASASPDSTSCASTSTASHAEAHGMSRRTFIATALVATATPALAKGVPIVGAAKTSPILPPGVASRELFLSRCTACGLCVDQCRGHVLRPSTNEYGWLNILTPVLDFDRGRCLTTCNDCTLCCPTGAIGKLTLSEKNRYIIGTAVVTTDLCIGCGRCARVCPHEAITMEAEGVVADCTSTGDKRPQRLPVVATSLCTGCGACQNVCPVKPVRAIRVQGRL